MDITVEINTKNVISTAFSPDSNIIATGSSDNTIKLWRVSDGRLIKTLNENYFRGVYRIIFSPDGTIIASCGESDETVSMWRVSDGKLIGKINAEYELDGWIAFSPDGSVIACSVLEIMLWRVSDGKFIQKFESPEGHTENIHSAAFKPDGSIIASGSWDGTIKFWRVTDGSLIKTLTEYSNEINRDGTTRDDKGNIINLWDDSNEKLKKTIYDNFYNGAISPDGRIFAGKKNNYDNISIWKVTDSDLIGTLETRISGSFVFSSDSSILAIIGDEKIILCNIKIGIRKKDGDPLFHIMPKKKKIFTEPSMVLVEGGTFIMGSNYWGYDEEPEHAVTVNSFYIGKYEVTQKEWKEIMGYNPCLFKGDDLPIEQVSWNEIQEFLKELNENTGKNYRLPTEAEWEYASQGGNKSEGYMYSGSNNIEDVAWYSGNSDNKTHPVGTKLPNELGIYDMSGNVSEWCNDWYAVAYYRESPNNNPQGPPTGDSRTFRNGSYLNCEDACEDDCRHSYRLSAKPDYRNDVGFRVVRDV